MPYKFSKTKSGITATKPDGKKVHFNTTSLAEAKRRAAIRESYAHKKSGKGK